MQEFSLALSRPSKVSLALWGLLLVLSLGLLHMDVRLPEPLPDGLYVFKTHTPNVKIQYLTSLPADNYIPFAVAEFFLRGVSFKKERPILPANEVSNRTILMSLVALPFRAALGAPHDHPQLGTLQLCRPRVARCIETKYGRLLRTVCCRWLGPEFVDAPRVICFLLQPRRQFHPARWPPFSMSRIRISSPRLSTRGPKQWLGFLSCSPGPPSAVAMGRQSWLLCWPWPITVTPMHYVCKWPKGDSIEHRSLQHGRHAARRRGAVGRARSKSGYAERPQAEPN